LVVAGNLRLKEVVARLMDVAKHDPIHNDAVNALSIKGTPVLYEPIMLTALITNMKNSVLEEDKIPLLVSAYPDLQPWLVKTHITACESEKGLAQYYKYLSLLLDPTDGSDEARHNKELVCEWSEWSSSNLYTVGNLENFYTVASNENEHLYFRDLPSLLNMSMNINDYDLRLDLVNEIISHPSYGIDTVVISSVLNHLRLMGNAMITQKGDKSIKGKLIRVIQSLHQISTSNFNNVRSLIHFPDQLYHMLESHSLEYSLDEGDQQTKAQCDFIEFLSDCTNPNDVLEVIKQLVSKKKSIPSPFYVMILQKLLKRAAQTNYQNKFTGALLRLQKARNIKYMVPIHRKTDLSLEDALYLILV